MPSIARDSVVVVDLSDELALGDTILRIGPLQVLQAYCSALRVISSRRRELVNAGIRDVIPPDEPTSIDHAVATADVVVLPPRWMAKKRLSWLDRMRGTPRLVLLDALLDSNYELDAAVQARCPVPYALHPFLNRVTLNFTHQLRDAAGAEFEDDRFIARSCTVGGEVDDFLVAIGDNASQPHKRWSWYADLVDALCDVDDRLRFAFVDANTGFTPDRIATLRHPERVAYSARRDDPGLDFRIMWRSALFVGNDSGPAHLFSMLAHGRKPMLVLFSNRVDPGRWAPNGHRVDFICASARGELIDRAGYDYFRWQEQFDSRREHAINAIPIQLVCEKLKRALAREPVR